MKPLKENNFSKIYKFLQLGGKHTTQELSEYFQLSRRTIQSYLHTLCEEYGLQKKKRYYYFPDNYRHIEETERVQMSTALMISLYKNAFPFVQESVLKNFKKVPKEIDAFLFDIDFQEIENETYFNQVTHAIINEKAIHFYYTNTQNTRSLKNIYPLKITNILGYWYLMGYDLEQSKVKTFYFNNIQELTISKDESYLALKQLQYLTNKSQQMYSPWFNDEKKTITLQLSGEAVRYMKRQYAKGFIFCEERNNILLVKMEYYNDIEVLTFVKKWLPDIKIVDNSKLKTKLHNLLQDYLSI